MPSGGCKSYQSTTQKVERVFSQTVGLYSLRTNAFGDELADATYCAHPENWIHQELREYHKCPLKNLYKETEMCQKYRLDNIYITSCNHLIR